jgi:hypothetical protein
MAPNPASHANTAREPGPAASSADRAIAPAPMSQGALADCAPRRARGLVFGSVAAALALIIDLTQLGLFTSR